MVHPYLTFHGSCAEALKFYQTVFETEIKSQIHYADYVPEGLSEAPAGLKDWVLHAEMEICGTPFWFADEATEVFWGDAVKLTATVPSGAQAKILFDRLSQGGTLILPPTETFYSVFHASVKDPFGIVWNLVASEPPAQE